MSRLAISVAVLSGLISALGAHKASAQLGLDSIVRQLGERAVEELVRPDPPQTTAPRTTAPTPQRHTAPSGPTQSEVLEVQQGLARLGYNPGTPDGLMGPNTASAIAAFQRDRGLRQTGAVTDAMLTRLRTAVAGSGSSGGGAAPQDVARPSFDCERAGTPTEYAICGNPELAQLDRQMADAYAAARAQAANPSVIANAQRSWMSRRNACRSDVDCLRASIQDRLATLGGRASRIAQGGATDAFGNGFAVSRQNGGNAILKGEEAYTALLRRYIRAHDDVENERAFLLRFAGLGCRAQGWERQSLNPFDRQEITAAAATRLADIRSRPASEEPLIFEYTYGLTLEDYDFETESFPFVGRDMTDSLRPTDFCLNLVRDAGEIATETSFPSKFVPFIGGKPLEPEALSDLLGGSIVQDQASARAIYEQSGFPRVNVRIVGQAGTPMLAGRHTGSFVPFTPLQAEVRLAGAEDEEAPLAVLRADDFNLPETSTEDTNDGDGLPKRLTALDVTEFFLREHEEVLSDPSVASVYAYSSLEKTTSVEQGSRRPERCVPMARLNDHEYNEFDIQELLTAAPQRALQRLHERPSAETFSVQLDGKLGSYDSSRGGFPVEDAISRRSDWKEYIQLHLVTHRAPLADCLRQRADLRTPTARARDNGMLNFVPMEREAAERFVTAAPERSVSVTMILRTEEASRLNHHPVVTFAIERAEVIAEATGETLLEIGGDNIEADSADADELWSSVPQLEGPDLFLEAVRRDADKSKDENYSNRWIEVTFCGDMQRDRDNPIRLASLFRDNANALARALDENDPLGPRAIRMSWVKLGDYDLDQQTFPLVGHSLDGERPLRGFRMQCRGVETRGANVPEAYEISVNGLAEIAQTGLPLSLEDADAYIQSNGGRRNLWERIDFFVIIDNVQFGAVDSSGVQQIEADAIGYRIADRSGDEILHEASFGGASKTENAKDQVAGNEGAKPVDAETSLSLLGLSIGMPRDEARAKLAERFGDSALAPAKDGTLIAERGPCRYAAAADPAIETEAGSNCVMVVFGPDDAVSNIVVRYVVVGSHVDAYAAQMEGNFGIPPSRVHSEQVPDTLILGWGPELEATAAELERDASAGQTLHALEARLTHANGITLATARLDSDPVLSGSAATDEGDAGDSPPPIEF